MSDGKVLFSLLAAASLAGLGTVYLTVWDAGMAAAWQGDTETVGTVIIVLVFLLVASVVVGLARGEP